MNTDEHGLRHSEIMQRIIGVFFQVYSELGYGFLESVYVEALAGALRQSELRIDREVPLAVRFRGRVVGRFRADLVVGGTVLVEVKPARVLGRSTTHRFLTTFAPLRWK
jgi:GxxExxY protein